MKTGYYRIKVTKPCLEGWDEMAPTEKGKFCQTCSREVIDFSVLSDEEIKSYLVQNAGKPACGHFKNSQLERIRVQLPGYFFQKKIPAWQKYFVVLLICFGSQMFSLDITVENHNGLYAQNSAVTNTSHSQKQKKKNKKKIQGKSNNEFISFPETLGMIYTTHTDGLFKVVPATGQSCTIFDFTETNNTAGDGVNTETMSANPTPLNKEKKKDKKPSFPKLEFTVPAAFAYRAKRKRNSKK